MEKLTLIIGNKNYSSWSLRPWIFMKTAGIEFEEKRVALFTDTTEEELNKTKDKARVDDLGFVHKSEVGSFRIGGKKFS